MTEEGTWYVLNHIAPAISAKNKAAAVVERFNAQTQSHLQIFAPTFVRLERQSSGMKRVEKPLLFHYVFVRGTEETVKRLCGLSNGFSLVINRSGNDRYATLSDEAMESFRMIARFYGNQIPCFATDEVDFEAGDLVEVMTGEFAGLTGTYITRKGGHTGNILISVTRSVAAAVYDIKPEYVKVLEFARDSKRAYDQIEAHVVRLYAALRAGSGAEGDTLPSELVAPLLIFSRRFDSVRLNNPKLEAKMQLLLLATDRILGNAEGYERAAERYDRLRHHITNPWTQALASLLIGASHHDRRMLDEGFGQLPPEQPRESKAQQALRAEYRYHLSR